MLVLQMASIEPFLRKYPAARKPIERWTTLAVDGQWSDITELRRIFPTADAIRGTDVTCFNIGGNKYRLLVVISYPQQAMVIRELLTHAEYTKKYT